jgi:Fur family ferric uptake transcriptional regulator
MDNSLATLPDVEQRESTAGLSTEEARQLLRAAKLRCTSCRLAVLRFLSTAASPMSHTDVAEHLVPTGYDKSTIYRSLVEMAESGLLARLDLGDHAYRFELRATPHDAAEHPHFVCIDCGRISCLGEGTVRIAVCDENTAAEHEITEVLLKGRCPACR